MNDMFAYCHKAIAINLPNFRKTKVNNMHGIFFQDFELKYINLSNFDVSSSITTIRSAF